MKKLTLNTRHAETGNPSGTELDTLAIAVDGRAYDDIENWEGSIEAQRYVLDNWDYESDMLKGATKAILKVWLKDPEQQAEALKLYAETRREAVVNESDTKSALYKAVQDAIDSQSDDDYKMWVYGDYRNWAGILKTAARKYGYDSDSIEFSESKGEVYAAISPELIDAWLEDQSIDRKSQAYKHLENLINNDAEAEYYKRQEVSKKLKAERERVAAYKAGQAKEAEAARQKKIKSLIKAK